MSRTVFILGAGASVKAGAPVMADFLDRALDIRDKGGLGTAQEAFDSVWRLLSSLQRFASNARLRTRNIEDVFSAVEMGLLLDMLPGLNETEKIRTLSASMKRVVCETLDRTVKFHFRQKDTRVWPPKEHVGFVDMFRIVRERCGAHAFAIISFNYDLVMEHAIVAANRSYDYVLSGEPASDKIPLLKLHGSGNWLHCAQCNAPFALELSKIWGLHDLKRYTADGEVPLHLNLCANVYGNAFRCPKCDLVSSDIIVVPPTWNKTGHSDVLRTVWRAAARELSEAENIIFMGYSLPETDLFFRYFLALACSSNSYVRRFWVINPDRMVEERFKAIAGEGILNSEAFRFDALRFEDAVDRVKDGLSRQA